MNIPPITAVVICHNEAVRLARCLESLAFCHEIVVIDLESRDESATIARRYADRVFVHPRVNHADILQAQLEKFTSAQWVLLIDPDEIVAPPLAQQLLELLATEDLSTLSTVRVPWRFRFVGRPLKGTVWGGERHKGILHNRAGTVFTGVVHEGRQVGPGYREVTLGWNTAGDNVLEHFWMDSWRALFEKHRRYLLVEGEAMSKAGLRHSWGTHAKALARSVQECLLWRQGWRDGLNGVLLTAFWLWYTHGRWLALRRWQQARGSPPV